MKDSLHYQFLQGTHNIKRVDCAPYIIVYPYNTLSNILFIVQIIYLNQDVFLSLFLEEFITFYGAIAANSELFSVMNEFTWSLKIFFLLYVTSQGVTQILISSTAFPEVSSNNKSLEFNNAINILRVICKQFQPPQTEIYQLVIQRHNIDCNLQTFETTLF